MKPVRIQYFQSELPATNRVWYVRIKGANGEKMLVSESYGRGPTGKAHAKRAAERVHALTVPGLAVVEEAAK